jgi:predicted PurR-regulated permease PerM
MLNDAGLRVRRYFVGTTVVAAMDAVVITLAAVLLRLPLLPVIALVTFVAAFVPYLGAWLSGIFVVVVALGSGGVATALWMLLIVLITQNVLEGVARPLAYGAALDLHPLTVLAATLLGGLLGGLMGVLIAPPLVAIVFTWIRTARSTAPATRTSGTRSG